MIAVGPLSLSANQRAHAISFIPHGIQRIDACNLDVELSLGILVEEVKRRSGVVVPFAVDISLITADTLQMSLQQSRNIGLIDLRSYR